jgi:hypothetical protein
MTEELNIRPWPTPSMFRMVRYSTRNEKYISLAGTALVGAYLFSLWTGSAILLPQVTELSVGLRQKIWVGLGLALLPLPGLTGYTLLRLSQSESMRQGLDAWYQDETVTREKGEACVRIMEAFFNAEGNLDLSRLKLNSLPSQLSQG